MSKRLEKLKEFENLIIGDKVVLVSKKGKIFNGVVEDVLTNRGYIDLNEINIYVDEIDYTITINVDDYLIGSGALKDFILSN